MLSLKYIYQVSLRHWAFLFLCLLVTPTWADVVINEILYRQSLGTSALANDEFIELYNNGSSPVDIGGWKLADGDINDASHAPDSFTYTFPPGTTLNAGQYAVVWLGTNTSTKQAPSASFQDWAGKGVQLNNTGDDIQLFNALSVLEDYVAYGSGSAIDPPPSASAWDDAYKTSLSHAAKGQSISLTANGVDGNSSACWEKTTSGDASGRCSGALSTADTDSGGRVASPGEDNNNLPKLTLLKEVINDDGGSAVDTDFTLTAAIPTVTLRPLDNKIAQSIASAHYSGTEGEPAITNASVFPATYILSETGPTGYSGGSWSCTGGSLSEDQLTLVLGDKATCTIVNDDQPAKLKLVKTVVNNHGGTATVNSFTPSIDATTTSWNTEISLSAGTHTASESSLAGYTAGAWGGDCAADGSITLANGQSATCTITNTDQPATLKLVKTVVNNHGGTATVTSFTPSIDATATTWNTEISLSAGAHTASESSLAGYTAGAWGGDCTADGSITLINGQSATCTITNTDDIPSYTMKKEVDKSDIAAPGTLNYSFTFVNTGTTDLKNLTLTDSNIDSGSLSGCPIANLVAGATQSCSATRTITQAQIDAGVALTNTAIPSAKAPDGVTAVAEDDSLNDNSTSTSVTQTPKYNMVKTANPASLSAPGTISYTFTFTNTGNVKLSNLTVADNDIDANTFTCHNDADNDQDIDSLALNATETCTATRTITQAQIDAGLAIENTAVPSATAPDGTTIATEDTITDNSTSTTISQLASITLDKSASAATTNLGNNPDIIDPDDTITYTLVMTNNGNVTLNNIIISDPLLNIMTENCAATSNGDSFLNDGTDTLDVGESVSCTAVYILTQSDIDAGGRDNTATVNAKDPSGITLSASDSVVSPLTQKTSIDLLKTAGIPTVNQGLDPTKVDAGDSVSYTFDIKNTGNVTLSNISVTDLSLGISPFNMLVDCGSGSNIITSLAANATHQCTATYTLTQDDIDGLNTPTITNNAGTIELSNTAKVTGTPPDGSGLAAPVAQSSSTATAQLTAAISLEKTAGAIIDKDNNGVNSVGDEINYTYIVSNKGVTTLKQVKVTEDATDFTGTGTLPAPANETSTNTSGLSYDTTANDGIWSSLAPGDKVTFNAIYTLTQDDIDAGKITNEAKATGNPPIGLGTPEARSSILKIIKQEPALSIEKTADNTQDIVAGQTITYSYVIRNTGNITIDDITVTDNHHGLGIAPIPANGATTLAPGQSTTFTSNYIVTQSDIDKGINVTNTATANGTPKGGDLDPASDDESIDLIDPAPKLTLEKYADANDKINAKVGQVINYHYQVTNTGNITIDEITVSDVHQGSGVAPIPSGGATSLEPGESTIYTASYIVTQTDVDAGVNITNVATANGTPKLGTLMPPSDNESIDLIDQKPALSLVKIMSKNADEDGSHSISLGDTLTYKITASNNGNITLSNVTVTDNKITPNSIYCATLNLSESCELEGIYHVTQADVDAGKIDNIASAATPDISNIPDVKISTPVASQKSLSLEKSMTSYNDVDNTHSITAGDILTYEIVATNTGTATLTKLLISDPLIAPNSKTCANVPPATTCKLTGVYTVTNADASVGKRENTATATSDQTASVTAHASVIIQSPQSGTIHLIKTGYPGHNAGGSCGTTTATTPIILVDQDGNKKEPVTYCFAVTNTDEQSYLTNIQITDTTLGKSHADLTLINGPEPVALEPGATLLYYIEVSADKSLMNTAKVIATPSDEQGNPTGLEGSASDIDTAEVALVVDPPSAYKTVTPSGATGMQWQMVWINTSTIAAPDVFVFDEIPEGTHFEAMPAGAFVSASGVYCEARGTSSTNIAHDDNCYYEAPSGTYPRGRVIWKGTVTSDAGLNTEETANNEVVIRFISVLDNPAQPNQEIKNQGYSEWDYNHDGHANINVPTDNPDTGEDDDNTVFKPINAIPTLSKWLLLLLALLLFIVAKRERWRYLNR